MNYNICIVLFFIAILLLLSKDKFLNTREQCPEIIGENVCDGYNVRGAGLCQGIMCPFHP